MNFHEANQRFLDFSRAASRPSYSANEPAMETALRIAKPRRVFSPIPSR